jgi:hypothetical protein
MAGTLIVLSLTYAISVAIRVAVVISREYSQFSNIFVLASQYRSHSAPLVNAAHCPRWFLSIGSRRLHSMQKGSGRIPMRWRCVPMQSCPTRKRSYAIPCEFSTIVLWPPSLVLPMQTSIFLKSRNIVSWYFFTKFPICVCRLHNILYFRKISLNHKSFPNFNPWFVFNLCSL